ncbi:helix-turn-helix domain-containing protein [Gordonia sp. MMO-8]|uniref:helix-turn-helix domain-containing protein n=1 Tax=Gordonia sp. MMO-8 TaxID=3127886 RepID=UPI003018BE02
MTASTDDRIPLELIPDPAVRAEWEHFRGYNMSDAAVGRRLGIPLDTVNTWRRRTAQRAERTDKILHLSNDGRTDVEIAAALDVSVSTVERTRTRNGHMKRPPRSAGDSLADRRQRVSELVLQGRTSREIADGLGVRIGQIESDRKWLRSFRPVGVA